MICVSIAELSLDGALAAAKQAADRADVLEIRLDALDRPQVAPFIGELATPLLFTNRTAREGGSFSGSEEERVGLLLEAVRLGAAFVDIELATESGLRDAVVAAARASSTRVIVSWHNFAATPPAARLEAVVRGQQQAGAHIGKVVTMAKAPPDVLRVLGLQTLALELGLPLIAFCMGPTGAISRLATLKLGGFMSYAAPDSGKATAPGQFSVGVLREMLARLPDAD